MQGKHSEAEVLYRSVLATQEEVLGPEHPDTMITLGNLAVALDNQGDYAGAEKMYACPASISFVFARPASPACTYTHPQPHTHEHIRPHVRPRPHAHTYHAHGPTRSHTPACAHTCTRTYVSCR